VLRFRSTPRLLYSAATLILGVLSPAATWAADEYVVHSFERVQLGSVLL
jgi:hypothetical protein